MSTQFPPVYRLRKADEYTSVFAFRRAVRAEHFMLHYRPSSCGARLGVVVAKKLARRAVQRNLVKRLSREIFRHARDTLPAYDLILRLGKPIAACTRRQLRAEIVALLQRLPAKVEVRA